MSDSTTPSALLKVQGSSKLAFGATTAALVTLASGGTAVLVAHATHGVSTPTSLPAGSLPPEVSGTSGDQLVVEQPAGTPPAVHDPTTDALHRALAQRPQPGPRRLTAPLVALVPAAPSVPTPSPVPAPSVTPAPPLDASPPPVVAPGPTPSPTRGSGGGNGPLGGGSHGHGNGSGSGSGPTGDPATPSTHVPTGGDGRGHGHHGTSAAPVGGPPTTDPARPAHKADGRSRHARHKHPGRGRHAR